MENSSLSEGETSTGDVKEGTASPSPPVLSDFSIEHILSSAGTKRKSASKESTEDLEESIEGRRVPDSRPLGCVVGDGVVPTEQQQITRFEWLQCTRYHPPKLQRSRRKESGSKEGVSGKAQSQQPQQRRKLGRNPRIPFSSSQVSALEQRFRRGHYLSSADVATLSSCLRLSETRVKIWFQNRRARERRDREARAAAKTSEGAATPQETSPETTTRFITTPPASQALPSITDSPVLEHRLRPSASPITGTHNHLFGFHTPALFPVHPSPITFSRGSQGLTSAFIPISPHIMSQSQPMVGVSAVPRSFLAAQHKIATNSTV